MPKVDVRAKGGSFPNLDLEPEKIVVGTKETLIEVPKVKTEKEIVAVRVLCVSDGDTDRKN